MTVFRSAVACFMMLGVLSYCSDALIGLEPVLSVNFVLIFLVLSLNFSITSQSLLSFLYFYGQGEIDVQHTPRTHAHMHVRTHMRMHCMHPDKTRVCYRAVWCRGLRI